MAIAKKPTSHQVLVLTSIGPSMFEHMNGQLDALAEQGWTVYITQIEARLGQLTVYGWATK